VGRERSHPYRGSPQPRRRGDRRKGISFFYVDGGSDWVDEDTAIDAPRFAAAFQAAEGSAARFAETGAAGVVLRFALFYGAGSSHTNTALKAARRGLSPFPGPRDGYQAVLHLDDAATAVLAALDVPTGIYNVAEDEPATRRELAEAIGAALHRRAGWSVPGFTKLGGQKTSYMARSVRVSNRRFREASGWAPSYPNPFVGWEQVVNQVAVGASK